jgi:DNA-binding transcriptional ArsR family regulator
VAITPNTAAATETTTAAWKPSSSACGESALPALALLTVGKSTASHHLKVLLRSGLTIEREEGTRKFVRLRRDEIDARFPGLLASVLRS